MMLFYNNNINKEGHIRDEEFVQLGKKHGIPTFNDADDDVTPVDNLWKYTKMGFDLVTFSAGQGYTRAPELRACSSAAGTSSRSMRAAPSCVAGSRPRAASRPRSGDGRDLRALRGGGLGPLSAGRAREREVIAPSDVLMAVVYTQIEGFFDSVMDSPSPGLRAVDFGDLSGVTGGVGIVERYRESFHLGFFGRSAPGAGRSCSGRRLAHAVAEGQGGTRREPPDVL